MASTNKTTNYELSQYIGTDKPTYLGDYNGDMQKIDTAMKANADNIVTANTNATNAVSTANTASTNASSALASATSASNTANSASSTANSALAKATANEDKINNFNLSSFTEITSFTKTGSGTVRTGSKIYVAKNTDGSLAKIYGDVTITAVGGTGKIVFNTPLRPTTEFTVVGGAIGCNISSNQAVINMYQISYTLKTNGDVEFDYNKTSGNNEIVRAIFINSLLYVKDFGDTPVE